MWSLRRGGCERVLMDDSVRCFVAVPLPDAARKRLQATAREVARLVPAVRVGRPESLHLTLRFLGDVDAATVSQLALELEGVASFAPFTVRIDSIGVFPGVARPRVLWAGVDDAAGKLVLLAGRVRDLTAIAAHADDRPFRGHITIARFRGPSPRRPLREALAAWCEVDYGSMPVDRVELIRSHLRSAGASYEVVARSSLGRPRR